MREAEAECVNWLRAAGVQAFVKARAVSRALPEYLASCLRNPALSSSATRVSRIMYPT